MTSYAQTLTIKQSSTGMLVGIYKEEQMANDQETERPNYEKLRDELLETRVNYKTLLNNFKMLAVFVTIVLAIIAYFGYGKIDSIESKILEKANIRLAKTDALLAKIDDKKIDELNKRLSEKQHEYETTLQNFERVLAKNKELEEKLLHSLPSNDRVEHPLIDYLTNTPEDYFTVRQFALTFRRKEKQEIYLTFADNFDIKKANFLALQLLADKPNGYYLMLHYFFKVQHKLNKLTFTPDVPPGKYVLDVGFFTTDNGKETFYRLEKSVTVK